MILLRRPIRVFDVDALGIALLVALGAIAYMTAVAPRRAQASQNQALAKEAKAIEAEVFDAEKRLRGIEQLTSELDTIVSERITSSPTRAQINAIVNSVMLETEQAGLQVDSVEPSPPQRTGGHFVCDVIIVGRGLAPDFVEFLETLSAQHPYHSIQSLALTRGTGHENGACRFELHLQLHLLPDDLQRAPEDPS